MTAEETLMPKQMREEKTLKGNEGRLKCHYSTSEEDWTTVKRANSCTWVAVYISTVKAQWRLSGEILSIGVYLDHQTFPPVVFARLAIARHPDNLITTRSVTFIMSHKLPL